MRSIQDVINEIIDVREKGFSNHAADTGGKTKYGVTEGVARRAGYRGKMEDLPRYFAEDVYRNEYIDMPRFNQVYAVAPTIGMELIDTGINMGTNTSVRFFQRTLNALNHKGDFYPEVTVDGNIGPATMSAFNMFINRRGQEGLTVFLRALNCLQGARYIDIAEKDPSQEVFVYGWLLQRVGV